jgi:hypothetical protein
MVGPEDDDAKPKTELVNATEPPVVARLVVEIRSDGSRTIARGALEDATVGQKVALQAEGTTPLSLAFALAKAIFQMPSIAKTAARALLPARKK